MACIVTFDGLAIIHEVVASKISVIVISLAHRKQNRVVLWCALNMNGLRGIFNGNDEAMQFLEACI